MGSFIQKCPIMINYCGAWGRPLGCGGGSDGSLRILEVGQSFWARNLEWGAMGASKACATPGIPPHLPTSHGRCSLASEMSTWRACSRWHCSMAGTSLGLVTRCGAVRGIPGQDSASASHHHCDLSSRPQFPILENGHSNSASQTLRTWQSHLLCIDCCCWSYYYSERSQSISIKNAFFGFIFQSSLWCKL